MKTAVVLGAAGFVGMHVGRALAAAGYSVTGIGHGSWSREHAREWGLSDWRSADVTLDSLQTYAGKPDIIVQCAGSGSVHFSMTHPMQDYDRSVTTTLAALEFIRLQAPDCRFVLPSSAAVYGTAQHLPIQVDHRLMPVSPYGAHKKIAEDLSLSYSRHAGIAVAIVRLFSIYGIGLRKQLLWDACQKLTRGESEFGGTGEEKRDWLHVDDAAALLVVAGERATVDPLIVNGGTGRAVVTGHIVRTLANSLQSKVVPTFRGQQLAGDPVHYEADILAALAMGWKPVRELDRELERYAKWYLGTAA